MSFQTIPIRQYTSAITTTAQPTPQQTADKLGIQIINPIWRIYANTRCKQRALWTRHLHRMPSFCERSPANRRILPAIDLNPSNGTTRATEHRSVGCFHRKRWQVYCVSRILIGGQVEEHNKTRPTIATVPQQMYRSLQGIFLSVCLPAKTLLLSFCICLSVFFCLFLYLCVPVCTCFF